MKRTLDIALAGSALVVLAPLMALIALAVRLLLGSPVLFFQRRAGLHGHPFSIVKFRTLTESVDEHGRPLPDHDRMTTFGSFLRATSLDELPELWNVLIGEMSLVGPRPLPLEYMPHYSKEQARRHNVPPGLTGWAQINGRNEISWEEKFRLDLWYVEHCSLGLDLEILLITVFKVMIREGINHDKHRTMPRFDQMSLPK